MTDLTRRSLLQAGAAATASLIGLRPWMPAAALAGTSAAPGHLIRSAYSGLIGGRLAVRGGGRAAVLRLLAVSDLAGAAHDAELVGSEDAFALVFSGPLDAPLESGIHRFDQPDIGTFELFISPVDRPQADLHYEVVVDRSIGAPRSSDVPQPGTTRDPGPGQGAEPEGADAAAPGRRERLLRRVALRRTARGVRCEIALRPSSGVKRVDCRLMRRGKTLAVAARNVRDDRAVLRFGSAQRLPSGTYVLLVTTIDAAGVTSSRRRRLTLG